MNNERALNKVRKCLALPKSDNEHEAARALMQARKIMDKYNLHFSSEKAFSKGRITTGRKLKRRARHEILLTATVARAFNCTTFVSYSGIDFVGEKHSAQIAGYAFDTLSAQLKYQRDSFLKNTPQAGKRGANLFCIAWVRSIYSIVAEFAAPVSDQDDRLNTEYLEKLDNCKIGNRSLSRGKEPQTYRELSYYRQGAEQGDKVSLHQGVNEDEQTLIATNG